MKKVAFLVDGNYFQKSIRKIRPEAYKTAEEAKLKAKELSELLMCIVRAHINEGEELYRIFYYDCRPYTETAQTPVTKQSRPFSKTLLTTYKNELFKSIELYEHTALRMGYLRFNGWLIKDDTDQNKKLNELTDVDYRPDFVQKGVDMKLGIDISTLAQGKLVDRIVMICGDADFAPAAKLARIEGLCVTLDPMHASVNNELFRHVDKVISIDLLQYFETGKPSDLFQKSKKYRV